MEFVLDIVVVLLATLGILLSLVLVMPLSVSTHGEVSASGLSGSFGLKVRWALGVLGFDIVPGQQTLRLFGVPVWRSGPSPEREKSRKKDTAKRRARRVRRERNNGPLWFWQNRDRLLAAGLTMLRTLHLRGRVHGIVGLSEPDDTIWLALAIYAVADRLPEDTLDIEVDYTDLTLELEGRLSAWAIPLHVLGVGLLLFIFDRTARHAVIGAPAFKPPLTGEST